MKADEGIIPRTAETATEKHGDTAIQFWLPDHFRALPYLCGGVTTRTGGVSQAPFQSLNLGLHVSDASASVQENRQRAANAFGFSLDDMVCAAQIHGGTAALVGDAERGRGATQFLDAIPGADALISNTPGVLLTLFFADCLPILLVDPVHNAIGIAHAGWRGLVAGIIPNTISAMQTQFGTQAPDLLAAVGPGIGPCCFEVGPEVAAHFPDETRYQVSKSFVHLALAAKRALRQAGIEDENLSVYAGCTSCESNRWFSHRRDARHTGRMGAFLGITSQA